MATARAHPTLPFLPRHYYTTLGPPSPCIVVARVAGWGRVGPCGRHAGDYLMRGPLRTQSGAHCPPDSVCVAMPVTLPDAWALADAVWGTLSPGQRLCGHAGGSGFEWYWGLPWKMLPLAQHLTHIFT